MLCLNKEQFSALLKTDTTLAIHLGRHFFNIPVEDNKVVPVPCQMVSGLYGNFLVPASVMDEVMPYHKCTFQFLSGQSWLSYYSENSFSYLLKEMKTMAA